MKSLTLSHRLSRMIRPALWQGAASRRSSALRIRMLEPRIVLDASVAIDSGMVNLGSFDPGSNLSVTQALFDIGNDGIDDLTYRFELDPGQWWNDGLFTLSGGISLDGLPGEEAWVDGNSLYVLASFLETNAGGLTISGGSTPQIFLGTSITTAGQQFYDGTIQLMTDSALNAGTGAITFNQQISNPFQLTVQTSGDMTFQQSVDIASLEVSGGGQTFLNGGSITTSGSQTFNNAVILGADTTLNGTNLTFGSTVDGSHHLQINDSGATTFNGAVGSLNILASLTANAGGTTSINGGSVTTFDDQTYHDAVTLGANTTLTGITLTFNSTVDGAHSLQINDSGNTTFNGAVGGTTALTSITTSPGGTTTINGGVVTTTGAQTYHEAVTIGASTTITGVNLTFESTIDGAYALQLNDSGNTAFNDAIGGITALTSLTTNVGGTTSINDGTVTTTGAQNYNDAVSLGADTTLNGVNLTFGSTVNGGHTLQVNDSGTTTFNGAVGGVTALTSLTTNVGGTTAINGGGITTIETQTFNDAVTLGANATLTGVDLTFHSTVNGPRALQVNDSGATTFHGAVGSITTLASLTTNAGGTTTINGGTVTTTGAQTYNDAVTLGANTTLTGVNLTFGSTVDGAYSLQLDDSGNTAFNGAVGGATALTSLTTNVGGTTAINGGAVTTTGAQTYNDAVTLGADATLNGVNLTFGSTVSGGQALLVNDSGTTSFNGAVGGVTALASLTTDAGGTTVINGGSISTTGAQTYNDAVTLGANTTLTGVNLTFDSTVDGAYSLQLNDSGNTLFNAAVGGTTALTSLTTNAGGTTIINGGSVTTTGAQHYYDDVQVGTGLQTLAGSTVHFHERVDGAVNGEGNLVVNATNLVRFDKALGSVGDLASIQVNTVDLTFSAGTYIEVAQSSTGSVKLVATGTLVLPANFVVRAAYNGGLYDGVANTFLPRPTTGVANTALFEIPAFTPVFASTQNLDQSTSTTVSLTVGNAGERGLRLFIDWGGDVLNQFNRYEGPGGWADGDGRGSNDGPGKLYGIEGGIPVELSHRYQPNEVQNQIKIDNTFNARYAVFHHEAIVIQAARVEQTGQASVGTTGGPLMTLTSTMPTSALNSTATAPLAASTRPDLLSGEFEVQISANQGSVPFDFPIERPQMAMAPPAMLPPLADNVTFQQISSDETVSSSTISGRQQRFVLRLLSPDPTARPLAEVELPADSFQADRLERLFRELPDGAYQIELILGENTERPILRFDIRQGLPVVPQETLEGGQLKLEDIQEQLERTRDSLPAEPAGDVSMSDDVPSDEVASRHNEQGPDETGPLNESGMLANAVDWRIRNWMRGPAAFEVTAEGTEDVTGQVGRPVDQMTRVARLARSLTH